MALEFHSVKRAASHRVPSRVFASRDAEVVVGWAIQLIIRDSCV